MAQKHPHSSPSIGYFNSTRRICSISRIGEAGLDDHATIGRRIGLLHLPVVKDKRASRQQLADRSGRSEVGALTRAQAIQIARVPPRDDTLEHQCSGHPKLALSSDLRFETLIAKADEGSAAKGK